MMKRILPLSLALLLALSGCGTAAPSGDTADASGELIVFAAASLQETLEEIAANYQEAHPEVTITYNFDSSGTLKSQIEAGADCDLFLSAAPKQMNELEELSLINTETRIDLLENKVSLAVPENNPKNIESYDQLAELLTNGDVLLAMGNSDVPVGQYTQKIFSYYGLDETSLATAGNITYGSNVKEVTTQVSESAVDCGIIYATDAFSAGLTAVDTATPEMCGQVVYPAAVTSTTANETLAQDFLSYLQTESSKAVFERVGFSPMF